MPFIFSFRCHAQIKPFTPRASIVVGRHKKFYCCSSAIKRTIPINASASIVCGCLLLFYVVLGLLNTSPMPRTIKKNTMLRGAIGRETKGAWVKLIAMQIELRAAVENVFCDDECVNEERAPHAETRDLRGTTDGQVNSQVSSLIAAGADLRALRNMYNHNCRSAGERGNEGVILYRL